MWRQHEGCVFQNKALGFLRISRLSFTDEKVLIQFKYMRSIVFKDAYYEKDVKYKNSNGK